MKENDNNFVELQDDIIKTATTEDKPVKKKKGRIIKGFLVVLSVIVLISFISIYMFGFPVTTIWNGFVCTVNEIFSSITGSTSELIPEFPDDVDAKPVIYLYPESELCIDVSMNNVDFTATYPVYDNGWSIIANSDGTLKDITGREYNYLYWEGYSDYDVDMSEGFIVAKEDYVTFFEEKLNYIGLSDKEACDFISYWLPICNKYDFILISFQKDYGDVVTIDYSVEPDNELIVFVAIKGLDESMDIKEQDLSSYKEFKREGFVSVEWGGKLVK